MTTTSIIDQKEVQVLNDEGTEITYRFRLEHAGDVYSMFVSAAGVGQKLKETDHHTALVLMAQAEMIEQGLHVVEDKDPEFMKDIERFHQFFGLEWKGTPHVFDPKLFEFREKFIDEETQEYRDEQPGLIEALTSDDGKPDHRRIAMGLHQQLDARVDHAYVLLGAAYLQFGRKIFNEAWRRVQAANMQKKRVDKPGLSKRGFDEFDVVKPEGWRPPDHHDLVRDHAHQVYRHQAEEAEVNGANR